MLNEKYSISVPDFAIGEYGLHNTELLIFSSIFTYDLVTKNTATTKEDYATICGVTERRVNQAIKSLMKKGLIVLKASVVDNKVIKSYGLSEAAKEKAKQMGCKTK